jgi:hypothetical protein
MADLTEFIAETQREIIFDLDIYGQEAVYSRKIETAAGVIAETLEKQLIVSPQGTFQTVDNFMAEVGGRIVVFWVRVCEMVWADGKEIIPKLGDIITCQTNGIGVNYIVGVPKGVKIPTQFGFTTNFSYEDAGHTIMKIMTFKE